MSRTVSDVFVETLVAAGVKRVYGVVGGSLNGLGLTDIIRKNTAIEWLHQSIRPLMTSCPARRVTPAATGRTREPIS
jgi:hypothetical protein